MADIPRLLERRRSMKVCAELKRPFFSAGNLTAFCRAAARRRTPSSRPLNLKSTVATPKGDAESPVGPSGAAHGVQRQPAGVC